MPFNGIFWQMTHMTYKYDISQFGHPNGLKLFKKLLRSHNKNIEIWDLIPPSPTMLYSGGRLSYILLNSDFYSLTLRKMPKEGFAEIWSESIHAYRREMSDGVTNA